MGTTRLKPRVRACFETYVCDYAHLVLLLSNRFIDSVYSILSFRLTSDITQHTRLRYICYRYTHSLNATNISLCYSLEHTTRSFPSRNIAFGSCICFEEQSLYTAIH